MPVKIRTARPADRSAIVAVVRAAFAEDGRDGGQEVDILNATWSRGAAVPGLDLVAVDGPEIVGHVLGGRGRLGERVAIGLAPLAVTPQRQRLGIGAALTAELLARAAAGGWALVLVLGDPRFYTRLGFEPAGPLGIVQGAIGKADPHFQVCRLPGYDASWRGEFWYCWEL